MIICCCIMNLQVMPPLVYPSPRVSYLLAAGKDFGSGIGSKPFINTSAGCSPLTSSAYCLLTPFIHTIRFLRTRRTVGQGIQGVIDYQLSVATRLHITLYISTLQCHGPNLNTSLELAGCRQNTYVGVQQVLLFRCMLCGIYAGLAILRRKNVIS
jgi:hypothetical protein